jgi:hypothetical protein
MGVSSGSGDAVETEPSADEQQQEKKDVKESLRARATRWVNGLLPWLETAVLALLLAGLIGLGCWLVASFLDGEDSDCATPERPDLALAGRARWRLVAPSNARLVVALGSSLNQAHDAGAAVSVRRVPRGKSATAMPAGAVVGAFVPSGSLARRARSLGFKPVASAMRNRDGRSVRVQLCVRRPEDRTISGPGRYTGRVVVAGPRLRPTSVPVVVTVKAAVPELILLALAASLLAALLSSSSRPSDATQEELDADRRSQRILQALPLISGIAAGLIAAFVLYADDPTWGAKRGADMAELFFAAFAAAAVGLTTTVKPTRALRRRSARRRAVRRARSNVS